MPQCSSPEGGSGMGKAERESEGGNGMKAKESLSLPSRFPYPRLALPSLLKARFPDQMKASNWAKGEGARGEGNAKWAKWMKGSSAPFFRIGRSEGCKMSISFGQVLGRRRRRSMTLPAEVEEMCGLARFPLPHSSQSQTRVDPVEVRRRSPTFALQ